MATSDLKFFVRGGHAVAGPDLDDPNAINPNRAQYIVNNAAHVADCAAQPRVAMMSTDTSEIHAPDNVTETNTWYRIWPTEFRALLKPDGAPYPLRCRIAGARDGGAGTVTFAIVVTSQRRSIVDEITRAGPNLVTATSTSGTHAWLTASKIMLTVEEDVAAEAIEVADIKDAVGGERITTRWCWLKCEVWGKTTSVSSIPNLSGLYVAEYIGT